MRTLSVPLDWEKGHVPIRNLHLADNLILALIHRKDLPPLVPRGDDCILPGDEVTVIGEAAAMQRLSEVFGIEQHPIRSVVLIGGTLIAEHLAYFLLQSKVHVRLVDIDAERCEELAEKFPEATILCRDGRDPQFFKAERISAADVLICCTHQDGTNLLVSALAQQMGCPKAIALISDPAYAPLVGKMGVQPALSARVGLFNRIVAILHEETILSIASLCHDEINLVELTVAASSKLIGIPLADLQDKLPKELLIAAIQTQGRVVIGKGSRILNPLDTIVVVCPKVLVPKLSLYFHG